MMDKHICKAKDLNTGKWVYGYYVALPDEYTNGKDIVHAIFTLDCEHVCMGEYKDIGWYKIDPDTVCQCIGWHDSNKTPIFEKDIVEFVGPSTHRDLIWWCNEMNMMTSIPIDGIKFNGFDYWNGNYPKYTYDAFCFMMQDPYGDFREIRVVGNIVDNPELLEATK